MKFKDMEVHNPKSKYDRVASGTIHSVIHSHGQAGKASPGGIVHKIMGKHEDED